MDQLKRALSRYFNPDHQDEPRGRKPRKPRNPAQQRREAYPYDNQALIEGARKRGMKL